MHRLPFHSRALALALASACASGALAAGEAETREPGARPGLAVVQGDVIVATGNATRGVGYARERTWPDGVVPVWFDPALPDATRDSIELAVDIWNRAAGIGIRRVDSATPPAGDHVHFQPGEGCASWVGRRGGAQELWVSPDCTTGSIVHEIGHALGLEHEHVRPDRDQWIEIRWDHVVPEKRHNFDIAGPGLETLGAYDYDSIMHYGPDFFSADGEPTIRPLVGDPRIGQRDAPSAGDIESIARVYGTDLALAGSLEADELQLVATNFGPRGAHALELELSPGLVLSGAVSADGWTCETPGDGDAARVAPRCRLERLGAGASSALALTLRRVSETGAGRPIGRIEAALDAVNDDPEPGNDRLSLGEGAPGTAGSDAAVDGPGGATGVQVARSPFELLALADGASATRPAPGSPGAASPVPLTTIVATSGGASGDAAGRVLIGGGAAGWSFPALVAGALRVRRRRKAGRRGIPR